MFTVLLGAMNTLHNTQQLVGIEKVLGELMWLLEQPNGVLLIHRTVLESNEYLDMIFEQIKEP